MVLTLSERFVMMENAEKIRKPYQLMQIFAHQLDVKMSNYVSCLFSELKQVFKVGYWTGISTWNSSVIRSFELFNTSHMDSVTGYI